MSKKKKKETQTAVEETIAPCDRSTPYKQRVIEALLRGETVFNYKEGGGSMEPRIHRGQLQTLKPIQNRSQLKKGDIVLCEVRRNVVTHKIHEIRENKSGELEFLIGNNMKGKRKNLNGWTSTIYGLNIESYWLKKPMPQPSSPRTAT